MPITCAFLLGRAFNFRRDNPSKVGRKSTSLSTLMNNNFADRRWREGGGGGKGGREGVGGGVVKRRRVCFFFCTGVG